ncbi:MAG TPA: hypothetical protein VLA82_04750 [Actinomycetota bacterium]|nr:hypothetical protein [Actinomycetota bacterium]
MSDAIVFAIGSVVFIAVFTAALGLAYVRFAELGRRDGGPPIDDAHVGSADQGSRTSRESASRATGA